MPDATITSTASTFGTISGTFAADQSTITGTLSGTVAGTLTGSVGVPGPGLPAGGEEGQIIVKQSATDYDTAWQDNYAATLQATVRNETGATLSKGTVVYISGGAGNKPLVTKASASTESSSSKTFAILAEDIPTNQNGQAVTMGLLKGLDTTAFTAGANLWLSTTAGEIVSPTPPATPAHAVFLGNVVRVHANQGEIEVRIQNGLELAELHDVLLDSPADGQVLKYDAAQGLWINGTDSSGVAWGGITGTLSSQTDLQTALDGKYSTTNPAGYITSSALSPYLTSSTAASTYQTIAGMSSYLTTATAASTYYPLTNPSGYITSSALTGYATESWVTSQGYLTSASLSGYATESWVTSQLGSYLTTSAAASTYAALAGATFSGVVSFNGSSGVAAKSIGQFKSYTSGFESTDYSLQYDTGFQVVQSGTTVARLAASGLLLPSGGITFSDATTQTTAGISAATAAASYYPLSSNPAGYLTSAPVTSVAGKTGAVTLAVADVSGAAPLASPTFTGTPSLPTGTIGVTQTAGNSTTALATTAFVTTADNLKADIASPAFTGTPAAPTAAVDTNTTQLATTAYVVGQGYLKSATASSTYAPLASPSLTGTPTAPTATTGTNTTQIATTAFVTAAVPAFATTAQARGFTSTTTAINPRQLIWSMLSQDVVYVNRQQFTFTNVGTISYINAGSIGTVTRPGNAGACSSRARIFGTGQVDQQHNQEVKTNPTSHSNYSLRKIFSGRSRVEIITDSNFTWAWYHGKAEADGVGNLVRRGFGWKMTGGAGSRFLLLQVHNGTTLTSVTSSYAVTANVAFDWDIESDGAGNVTLYVNGTSVATSSAGPTGLVNLTPTVWQEEMQAAAALSSPYNDTAHSRGRYIVISP